MVSAFHTANCAGHGVATEAEVSAKQITGMRMRFIPEKHQNSSNQITTRSLVSENIF